MSESPGPSPVHPLPPLIIALSLVIFGIEVIFGAGARGLIGSPDAIGWRQAAIQDYAFFDLVFEWMRENGRFPVEHMIRFFSYPFVHYNFTHMLFVVVFLLALGNMVSRVFAPIAVLAIFVLSGVGGALAYGLVLNEDLPLAGGYPSVYGLIGAFTFILWVNLGAVGANQNRAFTLIGVLLGIQLLFTLLFGAGNDWVADIAGFATGFTLSFLFVPGGFARILDKLRQR